jgi:hypothetical protein
MLFSKAIVQVHHRHCRPAANETMLGLRRAVGTEVVRNEAMIASPEGAATLYVAVRSS